MIYVAFDLGKVIFNLDYSHFNQILSELDFDLADMERYMRINCSLNESGLFSLKDLFDDDFDLIESDELIRAWNDIPKLNPYMFRFLSRLKSTNVKIAFLSNIGSDHLNVIREKYPELMELADVQHMSCEVGIAKPKKMFYQSFLLEHPEYEGCMYFDDNSDNLEQACNFGFSANEFNLEKLEAEGEYSLSRKLEDLEMVFENMFVHQYTNMFEE